MHETLLKSSPDLSSEWRMNFDDGREQSRSTSFQLWLVISESLLDRRSCLSVPPHPGWITTREAEAPARDRGAVGCVGEAILTSPPAAMRTRFYSTPPPPHPPPSPRQSPLPPRHAPPDSTQLITLQKPLKVHLSPYHPPAPAAGSAVSVNECCKKRSKENLPRNTRKMGLSKSQRIMLLLGIDGVFFLVELIVGWC